MSAESAMTQPDIWPRARLEWIAAILSERFGQAITVIDLGTVFHVAPADVEGYVSMPKHRGEALLGSAAPCGAWDAASEGWQPPILGPLPAPGVAEVPTPLVSSTPAGLHLGYDILSLAYWMLSRAEEWDAIDLDSHGRFPAKASHAYRHDYLERPIVDEWLEILRQAFERQWPSLALGRLHGALRVSHDVDTPSRYGFSSLSGLVRAMAGDIVRRRDPRAALSAPSLWAKCRTSLPVDDPGNTFGWLMDVSERHGLTSAFYFICGRTDPGRDARYDPEHPAIRGLMREIHRRGHEIGLHPSYGTYLDPGAIVAEADRLRAVCAEEGIHQAAWGGRMHFLRWKVGTTLRGWEQAGMAYDSTLGYADRPGFRCGTCHEFPGFDPVAGERSKVRIRPLVAMECTVMAPRYMGLGTGEEALAKFLQLRRACEAVHGSFTLLWHNAELESRAKRELYEAVLH